MCKTENNHNVREHRKKIYSKKFSSPGLRIRMFWSDPDPVCKIWSDPDPASTSKIKSLENLSAEEAQDQVYREIRFDLCPPCQKIYLTNPIPGTDVSGSSNASGSGIST